jgi:hypothetical protein
MPWCDDCAKFWSPASLEEGGCPTCGAHLSMPAAAAGRPVGAASPAGSAAAGESKELEGHTPWHFKLLLVALVLYLSYRAWQGIDWLSHWAPKHL